MKHFYLNILTLVAFYILGIPTTFGQVRSVTLDERVSSAAYIVLGQITEKHGFWDKAHERINTLNIIEVKAYIKGEQKNNRIAFITEGGILDLDAAHVCPSDELEVGREYVLFLNKADLARIDEVFNAKYPDIIQTMSHFVLAVLPEHDGDYDDLFGEFSHTEVALFDIFREKHNLKAVTPEGAVFRPRVPVQQLIGFESRIINSVTDGTGVNPAAGFIGGTIVTNNEIIINGSGFGATAGTIEFPNADAGSGFIGLTNTSDLISWSATQIRAKIPRRAGTGTINVKNTAGTNVGSASITVGWAEICIDDPLRVSGCATSGSNIRHRTQLANQNSGGGYTFSYNNGTSAAADFSANTAAKDAFVRAIGTWRCASLVNFVISNTATSVGYVSNDNNSVVLFDNTLPANALAQCVTGYNGSCSTGCTSGIRWYQTGMDVRVLTVPATGFTWNYATAAPTGSQYDFETVMLHELGHGHGLGHVIDAAKTMHYAISNGVTRRVLSTQETTGASFRVSHSTAAQCNGSAMTALTNPVISAPTVTQPSCALATGTIVVNATSLVPLEYSINNGTSYQSSNTFSGLTPGSYNIRVRFMSCNTVFSTYASNPVVIVAYNFTPTATDTWTGCVSTVWSVAGNWMDGSVPTSADSVTIPNLANDPVISTAITLKNLTLQGGVTLRVTPTGSVTLIP